MSNSVSDSLLDQLRSEAFEQCRTKEKQSGNDQNDGILPS